MYKESGIKPNFSDTARRYGIDRHTVSAYWSAEGCDPPDGRSDRRSAFEGYDDVIREKAALPGVTKKAVHEYLLHRNPGAGLRGLHQVRQVARHSLRGRGPRGGGPPEV